jgi:hypothetical protein
MKSEQKPKAVPAAPSPHEIILVIAGGLAIGFTLARQKSMIKALRRMLNPIASLGLELVGRPVAKSEGPERTGLRR